VMPATMNRRESDDARPVVDNQQIIIDVQLVDGPPAWCLPAPPSGPRHADFARIKPSQAAAEPAAAVSLAVISSDTS